MKAMIVCGAATAEYFIEQYLFIGCHLQVYLSGQITMEVAYLCVLPDISTQVREQALSRTKVEAVSMPALTGESPAIFLGSNKQ
ncbi:hypothetical protein [Vagococcus acidifermentans]|uniref:hypothetical protein n=1 Tax=Vagococcus acidifermentans TaxID=564710 RepID=UPI0011D0C623|nr:hypothetical protein [Vagococcus acidifermentans]